MASCFGRKVHSVAKGLGEVKTTQKAGSLPNQNRKYIMHKGLWFALRTLRTTVILLFMLQYLEPKETLQLKFYFMIT